jgi:hypothetical protein
MEQIIHAPSRFWGAHGVDIFGTSTQSNVMTFKHIGTINAFERFHASVICLDCFCIIVSLLKQ